MQEIQKIQYDGRIITTKGVVRYRKGTVQDASQIAGMYEKTAIHKDNCQERLCKDNEKSFGRKGGMFVVMTEAQIRTELQEPASFWAVLEDESGKVIGCFWFLDKGREGIAFPMEILVSEEWSGNSLGSRLYYTSFCALARLGYKCSVCEVYEVTGFQRMGDGGRFEERIPVCLLNGPSYRVLMEIGGIELEADKEREISLEGLRVWVRPRRVLCWHDEVIRRMRRRKW